MESKVIKVLLIEDNADDALLIKEGLAKAGKPPCSLAWVPRLSEGVDLAASEPLDVVLLDLSLPDSHGLDTFTTAYERIPTVPIIVLTGLEDEEIATEAAQQGAQDYLVKGQVSSELLARSLRYAIERHRLLADLKQESQAKSLVLSTATHELKTPLTSIVGYVDRLLIRQETVGPVNQKQRRYLETVQRNAYRLKTLVDDLLDVSRIESGSLELCPMNVEVRPEVEEVIQSMQHQLSEKGLKLVIDVPSKQCYVWGDRLRFSQVVNNLVSNACKYSPEGATVTISSRDYAGEVQIDVADTGIGISPEDQSHLFSKFFRAANASTRQAPGTGLGLYITKHLVEAHGGSIWVESEPGRGTTVSFTWPTASQPRAGLIA